MSDYIEVTDQNFDQVVLQNTLPVLLDFWAPWCPPCRELGLILPEIAKEFLGKVQVAKMNIDEHTGAPARYGVMSIPTLFLCKDGQVIARTTGAMSAKALSEWIKNTLSL